MSELLLNAPQTMKTLANGDEEITGHVAIRSGGADGYCPSQKPSITTRGLKTLLKECKGSLPHYKQRLMEQFGVRYSRTKTGMVRPHYDPSLQQISPEEFSIGELYEGFLGHESLGALQNEKTSDQENTKLQEALSPVTASTFVDINAFNATIGGLIEVRIAQGFDMFPNIGEQLFENIPTRVNGGKLLGIPNLQLPSGPTGEGEEYPAVGMQERYIWCQPNVKYGFSLSLTREAYIYSLTPELLAGAEKMGKSLRYLQEYWMAAVAQGADIVAGTPGFQNGRTANTFLYANKNGVLISDTPNGTYQTVAGTGASSAYNYVNSLTNLMTSAKSFQAVQNKLNLMREPETGFPVVEKLKDVVHAPALEYQAREIVHGTQVLNVADGGTTNYPTFITKATNPVPNVRLWHSTIWDKQLVDSGVSQANADVRWLGGDLRKAFAWREVWPLSVQQSNPLSTAMLNTDTINNWVGSWFGVPVVRSPWSSIQSTN